MASRNKSVNLLWRLVVLPRAIQPCTTTRSLFTNRLLHKEISTPLTTKTLGTNFFSPIPRRPTSKLLQLLQNRGYNQHPSQIRIQRELRRQEANRDLTVAILAFITANSVLILALKQRVISVPEFLTARYPKLRDIDMFIFENFSISVHNAQMGRWWNCITHTFNHGDIFHLGCNMYCLWSFGTALSSIAGPLGLATAYVAGAVVASMYTLSEERKRPLGVQHTHIGASGSGCAIAMALATLAPRTEYGIILIPIGIPAWFMMGSFAAYSLYCVKFNHEDGLFGSKISHTGHLGGMGAGLAFGLVYRLATRRIYV